MKIQDVTAVCLAALLIVSTVASASDVPPGKYFLSIAEVYGSSPREWVFIVGGIDSTRGWGGESVCKSVASLEKRISELPRGSTLDWSPSDVDRGQSKFLKEHDIEDLKALCAKAGVTFTIHPGG